MRTAEPQEAEPRQFRRIEYLLDAGRIQDVFEEGLFRWMNQEITSSPSLCGSSWPSRSDGAPGDGASADEKRGAT